MPGVFSAGEGTRGFMHARQILYRLNEKPQTKKILLYVDAFVVTFKQFLHCLSWGEVSCAPLPGLVSPGDGTQTWQPVPLPRVISPTLSLLWIKANFLFLWETVLLCQSFWPWTFSNPPASTSLVLGSQKHPFVDSIVKIFFNSRPKGRPKKKCHIFSKQYFAE